MKRNKPILLVVRRGNTKSLFCTGLGNLLLKFRSSLRSIQSLGIVSSDLLKQRGFYTFLRNFLEDMISLRKGLTLTVRKVWYRILLYFARDIPASNPVAGFKDGSFLQTYLVEFE
jgi:hypothetical protein